MKNKRFARLTIVVTVCVLLLSILTGMTVFAASSGSESELPPATAGIEVTRYELFSADGSKAINSLNPNTNFIMRLYVKDTRIAIKENVSLPTVKINLNTNGFSYSEQVDTRPPTFMTDNTYSVDLPLKYNGKSNTFACDISYPWHTEQPMYQYSIELNQAALLPPPASESTSEPTSTVTRGTGFVLKSASYGDSNVQASKTFNLEAVLLATNGTYSVENVNVGLALPKEISLVGGNTTQYVGTVAPNKSIPVSFELLASAIAEEGSYVVTINVSGVNAKDGTEVSASMDISIPVVQPERFEISNTMLPEYLMVGMDDGSGYSSITLVNKGKGTVYNVSAEVVGEGLSTQEGNQFLGNIAAGGQNSADFVVMATQGGMLEGQVVITYENAKGEEKTLTKDFTVTAEEMMVDPGFDPSMPIEEPMPEQSGLPVWAWFLIILGVAAVGTVVLVVVLKKRKAKKAAQLEEDLDDDIGDDIGGEG